MSKFDNISKGEWKGNSKGLAVLQNNFVVPFANEASAINFTDREQVKQNFEAAAFALNLTQKYNIERFEDLISSYKDLLDYTININKMISDKTDQGFEEDEQFIKPFIEAIKSIEK